MFKYYVVRIEYDDRHNFYRSSGHNEEEALGVFFGSHQHKRIVGVFERDEEAVKARDKMRREKFLFPELQAMG